MDQLPSPGKHRAGRAATSCLECQRRKQKCSREWPCNHCQSRKVPHLCQFVAKKKKRALDAGPAAASGGSSQMQPRKRKESDSDVKREPWSPSPEDPEMGLVDGLAKLGYMPTHQVFDIGLSSEDPASRAEYYQGQPEEVEIALKSILPKPYTECLVQNFLRGSNYHYYSIYPPQLQDQCNQWWAARASGGRLSPEITCLLLRVCACSSQYLETSICERLELELGERAQTLAERFNTAAQKLSSTISPGRGGFLQVQQLFLTATWYKSEALLVESWHALSAACREAQELGMHKAMDIKGMTEFDREMRKRLWCILYAWDWQMATLLGRPILIDHRESVLHLPDGILEAVPGEPNIPSPIYHVVLQAQLGQRLSERFQSIVGGVTPQQAIAIRDELKAWMDAFPPAYRTTNPDTRWDDDYPYITFQRNHLAIIGYCYMLGPLKPWLTGAADWRASPVTRGFRAAGVETCLDALRASERFIKALFPDNAKYFFVLFFMFDAAAMLCSAIHHDVQHDLPRRADAVRALRSTLAIMDEVYHLTKTAMATYGVLSKLVSRLPLAPHEKAGLQDVGSPRRARASPAPVSPDQNVSPYADRRSESAGSGAGSPPMPGVAGPTGGVAPGRFPPFAPPLPPPPPPMATEWSFRGGAPPAPAPMHPGPDAEFASLGFEHLEPIWDWETLNLDLSGHIPTRTL